MDTGELVALVIVLLVLVLGSIFLCFRCCHSVVQIIEDEQKPKRQTLVSSMREGLRKSFRTSMRRVSVLRHSFRRGGRRLRGRVGGGTGDQTLRQVAAVRGLQRECSELHPSYLKSTPGGAASEERGGPDTLRKAREPTGRPGAMGIRCESRAGEKGGDLTGSVQHRVAEHMTGSSGAGLNNIRLVQCGANKQWNERLNIDYPMSTLSKEDELASEKERVRSEIRRVSIDGEGSVCKAPTVITAVIHPHYTQSVADNVLPPSVAASDSSIWDPHPSEILQQHPTAQMLPGYDEVGYAGIPIGHIHVANQYGRGKKQYGRRGRSDNHRGSSESQQGGYRSHQHSDADVARYLGKANNQSEVMHDLYSLQHSQLEILPVHSSIQPGSYVGQPGYVSQLQSQSDGPYDRCDKQEHNMEKGRCTVQPNYQSAGPYDGYRKQHKNNDGTSGYAGNHSIPPESLYNRYKNDPVTSAYDEISHSQLGAAYRHHDHGSKGVSPPGYSRRNFLPDDQYALYGSHHDMPDHHQPRDHSATNYREQAEGYGVHYSRNNPRYGIPPSRSQLSLDDQTRNVGGTFGNAVIGQMSAKSRSSRGHLNVGYLAEPAAATPPAPVAHSVGSNPSQHQHGQGQGRHNLAPQCQGILFGKIPYQGASNRLASDYKNTSSESTYI